MNSYGSDKDVSQGDRGSVRALLGRIERLPEMRMDRVAALKQQISSGTYVLLPAKIAERILDEIGGF